MAVVTRFAPSPTGLLHLGHVHAAAIAWRAARQAGGTFLLRLEDIDPARCRPAFAAAILEDLAWLGLHHDGEVRVQSAHLHEYREALATLAERGLIYPCFCSRAAIAREIAGSAAAPHGPDGAPLYPGTCRALPAATRAARLAEGAPHAWRLDMRAALAGTTPRRFLEQGEHAGWATANPAPFGDVVLARRDAPASYHFCVTHDDAAQGVTLVTRAEDLRPATHLHVLLQHLMGWPTPVYAHHRLLRGPDGARLAKRDGAASVRALRDAGHSAHEVLAMAGAPFSKTYR
jgi:glutamyl-Q tRNA(Asp) synthetase